MISLRPRAPDPLDPEEPSDYDDPDATESDDEQIPDYTCHGDLLLHLANHPTVARLPTATTHSRAKAIIDAVKQLIRSIIPEITVRESAWPHIPASLADPVVRWPNCKVQPCGVVGRHFAELAERLVYGP